MQIDGGLFVRLCKNDGDLFVRGSICPEPECFTTEPNPLAKNAEDEPYILTSFEALNTNVSNANLTIPLDDGTGTSWGLGVLNW